MDADCFDALARALAAARSRSSLARLLGGLSLGGILGTHTARQAAAALFNGGAPCTKGSECKTGKCLGSSRCSCSKAVLAGGSDGGRGRVQELFSPRRLAVPDLRPIRRAPCVPGNRYAERARRLGPDEEATIRAFAGTRSLRSLAAGFGVSHETVRSVLRRISQ